MAKLDQNAGTSYDRPHEVWEPTMHLAFFEIQMRKILHQQWRSNIGRVLWRPVPEMVSDSPDNE